MPSKIAELSVACALVAAVAALSGCGGAEREVSRRADASTSPTVLVVLSPQREASVATRRALDADVRASALCRRAGVRFLSLEELAAPLRRDLPGVGVIVVEGETVRARLRGLPSPRAFVAFVERELRRAHRSLEVDDPIARAAAELSAGFPARCLTCLESVTGADHAAIDLRVRACLEEGDVAGARAASDDGGDATARVTRARVALAERRLTAVMALLQAEPNLERQERLLLARACYERGDGPRAQAELRELSAGDDEVAIEAEHLLAAWIDPSAGHSHR
ncbi:MAG: hypothetical protein AB7I19_04875 [Planctomycetota bacterium]